MKNLDEKFQQAEGQYLSGLSLNAEERECMTASLTSTAPRTLSIACGALLRDESANQIQKAKAREVLMRLCSDRSSDLDKSELSITILLIPCEELCDTVVKTFIYELLKSSRFTLRANGVSALKRLASKGDEHAVSLLRAAVSDENEVVRSNAKAVLNKLKLNE